MAQMAQGHFPESSLVDSVQFSLQCISCRKDAKTEETATKIDFEYIFKPFIKGILQLYQTEGTIFQHTEFKIVLVKQMQLIEELSIIFRFHFAYICLQNFFLKEH